MNAEFRLFGRQDLRDAALCPVSPIGFLACGRYNPAQPDQAGWRTADGSAVLVQSRNRQQPFPGGLRRTERGRFRHRKDLDCSGAIPGAAGTVSLRTCAESGVCTFLCPTGTQRRTGGAPEERGGGRAINQSRGRRAFMALEIGYGSALVAGAISFLSPCVLPLVPPYLCYMAGVSMDDFRRPGDARARFALMSAAFAFVLGFSTVFVALGAGASSIGAVLRAWQQELAVIAGIVIIVMGLNFLGILRIPILSREFRFQGASRQAGVGSAYLMGLAFAFGWTPCIGPVLGPILTLAGARETIGEGALMLAVYSLGLGIPFLVAALFSGAFMRFMQRFRVHMGRVEKVIGGLLVLAGVLFLSGGIQTAAFWLLETFPVLGTLG